MIFKVAVWVAATAAPALCLDVPSTDAGKVCLAVITGIVSVATLACLLKKGGGR